jgi:hypothetical protein
MKAHSRDKESLVIGGIFAQDHTFEVVKNYQRRLGQKRYGMFTLQLGEVRWPYWSLQPGQSTSFHAAGMVRQRASLRCTTPGPHKVITGKH